MPRKLNRREAQLVRHARERAVADYEATREVRVLIGNLTLRQMSLSGLRSMNEFLHGVTSDDVLLIFDTPVLCPVQWIYWPDGFDPMI